MVMRYIFFLTINDHKNDEYKNKNKVRGGCMKFVMQISI